MALADVVKPYVGQLPERCIQDAREAFNRYGVSLSEVSGLLEEWLEDWKGRSAGFISDQPTYEAGRIK
jgi:hypothetical protein